MALTGSLTGNTCYQSWQAASDAYFSSQSPISYFDTATGNIIQQTYMYLNGMWTSNFASLGPASVNPSISSGMALMPVFAPCDPLAGWSDGLVFGGYVLAALSAAVFIAIVSRAK